VADINKTIDVDAAGFDPAQAEAAINSAASVLESLESLGWSKMPEAMKETFRARNPATATAVARLVAAVEAL